jgi:protease-4
VAVIYAEGEIIQGKSAEGTIGSESLSKTIRKVRELDRVKAIVFRVNSPGGDALAAEVIRRELELAAQKMPVIVSMGNLAASGGYWISTPGKFIFSDEATITGSIGVFGIIPDFQELLTDKIGVTFDGVKTNKNADFIDVTKPMSEFQKAKLNNAIKKIYHDFVSLVARSRKLDVSYVDSIARGRVWAGADAIRIGLVDTIGGLTSAIRYAAKQAGLGEKYRVREYPREKSFVEKLLQEMTGDVRARFVKSELGELYMYYEELTRLKNMKGVQARLPYLINVN